MDIVTTIALPIFALVFSGYGANRLRLLPDAGIAGLNGFVYYFALPALLFVKVAQTPILSLFDWRLLAAYHAGGLAVFAGTMLGGRLLFGRALAVLGLQGLAATWGNVGYMGLPLALAAFGAPATLPAVIIVVSDLVVTVSLALVLVEAGLGREGRSPAVARALGRGLLNPLLVSTFGGAALSIAGVGLPAPVLAFGELLGGAALPCALFALGASLLGRAMTEGLGEVGWLVALKLVVHPLAVWLLVARVFPMDPVWAKVVVLKAALPAAANVFVLAQRYGIYVDRASSVVFVSTLLSVVTVTAWLVLLRG